LYTVIFVGLTLYTQELGEQSQKLLHALQEMPGEDFRIGDIVFSSKRTCMMQEFQVRRVDTRVLRHYARHSKSEVE